MLLTDTTIVFYCLTQVIGEGASEPMQVSVMKIFLHLPPDGGRRTFNRGRWEGENWIKEVELDYCYWDEE